MYNSVASSLNAIFNYIEYKDEFIGQKLQFYQGEFTTVFGDILCDFAPCGKVAVLYFQDTYERIGLTLSNAIKSVGYKTTQVILPNDFTDAIELYSGIFNLAEDIRVIITADVKLYNLAKYFASIRNLPCILIYDGQSKFGLLSPSVKLKNGRKVENFNFTCSVQFCIDQGCFDNQDGKLSDIYAHIVSNALALVDYRTNCLFNCLPVNKDAYSLAGQAIQSAYSVFSNSYLDQPEILITALMQLELASALTKNTLTNGFCAYNCYLLDGKVGNQGITELIYATTCAKVYSLLISGEYDKINDYPNYLTRATDLGAILVHPQDTLIKNFSYQIQKLSEKSCKISSVNQALTKDISSFIDCSNAMLSTYKALKGDMDNAPKSQRFAVKHCGDCLDNINFMTLVRESGITESV